MKNLQQRILDISKKYNLSHISSCISTLPILVYIYKNRDRDDKIILDNAHAHLAHLVVREKYDKLENIEALLNTHGIHCDRKSCCDVSGGSLGHGIGIGIGLALADKSRIVYVVVSDGSMMEGSNWEALRLVRDFDIQNIRIHCNFNGTTATRDLNEEYLLDLEEKMMKFCGGKIVVWNTKNGEGFEGVQGHYVKYN